MFIMMLPGTLKDFCSLNPKLSHDNSGLKWQSDKEGKWMSMCLHTRAHVQRQPEYKRTCYFNREPTTLIVISFYLYWKLLTHDTTHLLKAETELSAFEYFLDLGLNFKIKRGSVRDPCVHNSLPQADCISCVLAANDPPVASGSQEEAANLQNW